MHSVFKNINKLKMKWAFAAVMLYCLFPSVANATHIIGGEINYVCLGDEQFEVELTVYRDCFFGADNAFFDDPASIGIFDSNGVLLDELQLPFLNNDTLTPILSDSCLFVPETVCVHTASYRGEVNLPFSAGGYTIVYQRCCRNETITNIVDPLNTGATFTATISGTSLQECNSGPKFREFPPLFICVNEPINWDHSAVDAEGDSLVYSLCTPFAGGDIINNQPQPPNPPPYETISWLPPFGLDNILGGTDVLSINPSTGLITGTPPNQGQFVVGVCIEEYRNGELISTSRRDFQYNVGECGIVAASIGNDTIQCENQDLTFINTSSNANDFEWFFGDSTNPGLNSILENPTYMFPDTGVFTITLIAEPNGECADTLVQDILFKNSTLDVDFDLLVLECVDSVLLTVNNMSVDTFLGIESVLWELSDGQTSDIFNPTFVLETSQEYTLSLTANAFDGCSDMQEFNFFGNVIESGVRDTFEICPGGSVSLNDNPFLGPNVSYTWSPAVGLDDVNSANPIASPNATTMYTVSIDDPDLECSGSFSVLVDVQENNAIIQFDEQEVICTDEYEVAAATEEIVSYEWSQDPNFSNIISTASSFTFSESGVQTFYLNTLDERGCAFTDFVTVNAGAINVDIEVDEQACLNQAITTSASNFDPIDVVNITWEPASAVLSGQGTLNALLSPQAIGQNTYYATISNQFGCERIDTFNVNVISDQAITDLDIDINRDNCDPSIVTFNSVHINIENYQYEFDNGTDIILGSNTVTYTFPAAGTYEVVLSPQDFVQCDGLDPINLIIEVPTTFFDTNFESQLVSCGDIIEVNLTDLSNPIAGTISTIDWMFSDGQTATGQNITVSFDESGIYTFEVSLNSSLGCTETYEGELDLTTLNILDLTFLDQEILACNGDPVDLNPNGNTLYEYMWTPASELDNPVAVSPLTSPSSTTTFSVVVTDPVSGCVVERDVTVVVPDQPLETDFAWAFEDCIGEANIQFTDLSVYSEGDIVEWEWTFSNSDDILTVQNPNITVSSIQDLNVTLTATTEDGCQESISQIIVVDIVDLNIPDDETFICFGESIGLNPNGADRYDYVWSPASELDDAFGANPIATPSATTTFAVTVTDDITGCIVEEEFTILVASEAPQAAFEIDILTCNTSAPLEVQFNNISSYADADITDFMWDITVGDETFSSEEENPIFVFEEAGIVSGTLSITTADGCSDVVSIDEFINTIDNVIEETDIIICNSIPTILNENGDPDLSYQWTPSTGLSDPNIPNPIANPDETTIYSVSISDPENGECVVVQEVIVTVPDFDVIVDFLAEFINCGTSAEVQFTDQTIVEGTDIIAWSWDFGNGTTSTEQNPVITLGTSAMLTTTLVVTTSEGCEVELLSPQSQAIEVIVIDETSFGNTLNICMGEDIFLNENPDDQYTYLWSPAENLDDPTSPNPQFINADESTEFTVMISNESLGTCSIERTVFVNVYDSPSPSINGDGQENICTAEGELSVDLGQGESVVWYDDPALIDVISTEATIITTPGQGTTYFAMVTNEFGCGSELVSFTSTSRELLLEPEMQDQILCLDNQTELNALVLSNEIPSNYVWSPLDLIDESLSETAVLVSPTQNTTYTLTASNDFGCETQILFNVEVVDLLSSIEANITTTELIRDELVTLSVTENDSYTYLWSPADILDDPTSPNPSFTLTEEVDFEVEITDENGCTAILTIRATPPARTPCAEPYVFVPNAFSPNGDGLNEELRVDGNQILEMHLTVYNRFGQQVFEADDQSQTWDGTFRGKTLDPDVFGYIFNCTCTNGETFTSQGNISLLK